MHLWFDMSTVIMSLILPFFTIVTFPLRYLIDVYFLHYTTLSHNYTGLWLRLLYYPAAYASNFKAIVNFRFLFKRRQKKSIPLYISEIKKYPKRIKGFFIGRKKGTHRDNETPQAGLFKSFAFFKKSILSKPFAATLLCSVACRKIFSFQIGITFFTGRLQLFALILLCLFNMAFWWGSQVPWKSTLSSQKHLYAAERTQYRTLIKSSLHVTIQRREKMTWNT